MRIILGSQSPRRKEIMNDAGYVIEVLPAHFDEESIRHHDPEMLTQLLATAKNKALQERVSGSPCIITADTVVTHAGRIYEKAQTEHEAFEWITSFMNSTIAIHTSHMIHDVETGFEAVHTSSAKVYFRFIPPEIRAQLAVHAYEASVAGGFHMSDPLLHDYVSVHGDAATVLGLDIAWVQKTLIHIEKLHLRAVLKDEYRRHALDQYVTDAVTWVTKQDFFMSAERVYAYHPITTLEIPFIDELMELFPGKQWVFPEIRGDALHFPHTETLLVASCVIVPALAVTPSGVRLGKGKGFYDKFLYDHSELAKRTLTVVPDFALRAAIPVAKHDVSIVSVHGATKSVNF